MRLFKNVIIYLIILLSLTTSSAVIGQEFLPTFPYPVYLTLPSAEIIPKQDGTHYILMESGFTLQNQQGYRLPVQLVSITIPQNHSILSYSVSRQVSTQYQPVSLQHFTSVQSISQIPSALAEFRSSNAFCTLTLIQTGKSVSTAVFMVRPCEYYPDTQALTVTTAFQIDLRLSPVETHPQAYEVPVFNKYHHCIVARMDKIHLLLEYKNFLEERGISTLLFPYEYISSFNGNKDQEKLRDFLSTVYMKHGIESVLIVGHHGTIPMMELAIHGKNSKFEEVVPSDMFYADLSSEWDSNQDGYFGEYGFDYIDYSNEINVGRLPFTNDSDITSYLQRLMSFFVENKDNRRKILTAGAWYSFKEEKYANINNEIYDLDGGQIVYTNYINYFPGFEHKGLYEHQGIKISKVVNLGSELSHKNFITGMNELDPLIVMLNGIGSRYEIKQKIWNEDTNNNKMVDYLEMTEKPFIDLYTYRDLTNRHQSIVFADSSSTMNPGVNYNLGTDFLKKNAVGYLGFTSQANYFLIHDANPLNYELNTSSFGLFANIEYFFSKEHTLGEAIRKGILEYWETCNRNVQPDLQPKQIQNIFALSLYGDPLLQLNTLPKKAEQDYQSQGILEKGSNTYHIKEVFLAQDRTFITFKCQIYEKLLNKNYQLSLFLDSDNNAGTGAPETNGADYFFSIGYNEEQKFLFSCTKWNPALYDWELGPEGLVYNRFGFDFTNSAVWIKFPRNMLLGPAFRYKIIFSNKLLQEACFFPPTGSYADYPSKQSPGPAQPKIAGVVVQNKKIQITFVPFQARTFPVAGFELYRRVSDASYDLIKAGTVSELIVVDHNYLADTTLYYKVRAFDNQIPPNFSLFSEEVSITTPKDQNTPPSPEPEPEPEPEPTPDPPDNAKPPQPLELSGSYNTGNKYILLKWSKPVAGDFPISGFEIYRGTSPDSISYYQTISVTATQFADTSVQPDRIYYYTVYVVDNQTPKHKSKASNTIIVETKSTPPPSPPAATITIVLIVGEKYAYVNNHFLMLDIAPLMKSDRVFVPLRFIAEAFGAKVTWKEDASRNGEGSITIVFQSQDGSKRSIQMHTLEKTATVEIEKTGQPTERKTIQLDAPAFIVKPANRTVVPIRFIAETFGATVEWKESNQSILITL